MAMCHTSVNPARSTGVALFAAARRWSSSGCSGSPTIVGGVVGALVYGQVVEERAPGRGARRVGTAGQAGDCGSGVHGPGWPAGDLS